MVARGVAAWQQADGYAASIRQEDCKEVARARAQRVNHGSAFAAGIHALLNRAADHGGHAAQHVRIGAKRCNIIMGGGQPRLPAGGPARGSQDRVARGYTAVGFVQQTKPGKPQSSSGSTSLVLGYQFTWG